MMTHLLQKFVLVARNRNRVCKHSPSRGRRGSVYILVLAVLSVLMLITLTLSYVSRMDLLSSRNWGNTVQSRMAAVTGVPLFQSNQASSITAAIVMPLGQVTAAARLTSAAAPEGANSQMRGGGSGQRGGGMRGGMPAGGAMKEGRGGGRNRPDAEPERLRSSGDELEAFKLDIELKEIRAGRFVSSQRPAPSQGGSGMRPARAANAAGGRQRQVMAAGTAQGQTIAQNQTVDTTQATLNQTSGLATYQIEDESAKLNINAVVPDSAEVQPGSQPVSGLSGIGRNGAVTRTPDSPAAVTESQLAQLIQGVMTVNHLSGVSPTHLAHAIGVRRYGANGIPDRVAASQHNSNASLGNANSASGLTSTYDAGARSGYGGRQSGNVQRSDSNQSNSAKLARVDPRTPVAGDDRPYASLMELMDLPGMTPALYRALTPYLTTFSVSFAAYAIDGRSGGLASSAPGAMDGASAVASGLPQIDPNTASPGVLLKVLKRRYPRANPDLLGQFIANLIDRRDADDLPTAVTIGGRTYYGMEITPCINEVSPNPSIGDDTSGQYVEIFNPWSKNFSLNGWSLRTQGMQVPLNGQLPSGAFLVLTNNFNNDSGDNSGGSSKNSSRGDTERGSFYDLYHKVDTGVMHHLVETPELALPSDNGRIQLVNADGMVVDEFEYRGGKLKAGMKSFQRRDPRLRVATQESPTPLDTNAGAAMTADAKQAMKIMEQWQNQPFRSSLDVMLVSTAFAVNQAGGAGFAPADADLDTGGTGGVSGPRGGQSPAYAMPQLAADESSNLDVRLVDCFRLGAEIPEKVTAADLSDAIGRTDGGASAAQVSAKQNAELAPSVQVKVAMPPRCETVIGRLNLNTAPVALLATLPGMDAQMLNRIAGVRSEQASLMNGQGQASARTGGSLNDPSWWVAESPFTPGRWSNLSDFIRDEALWSGRPLYDRLDAVYSYSQKVTLHTLAVRVVSDSAQGESNAKQVAATAGGGTRRPRVIRAERIIAADRGRAETVAFNYLGLYTIYQGDPDARYAAPTGQVQPLALTTFIDEARKQNTKAKTRGAVSGTGLGAGAVMPAALAAAATQKLAANGR